MGPLPSTVDPGEQFRTAKPCSEKKTQYSSIFHITPKELTSDRPFRWRPAQVQVFKDWIAYKGANATSADLVPLLRVLELDGYEGLRNYEDEDVYPIILKKVRDKLMKTRREFPEIKKYVAPNTEPVHHERTEPFVPTPAPPQHRQKTEPCDGDTKTRPPATPQYRQKTESVDGDVKTRPPAPYAKEQNQPYATPRVKQESPDPGQGNRHINLAWLREQQDLGPIQSFDPYASQQSTSDEKFSSQKTNPQRHHVSSFSPGHARTRDGPLQTPRSSNQRREKPVGANPSSTPTPDRRQPPTPASNYEAEASHYGYLRQERPTKLEILAEEFLKIGEALKAEARRQPRSVKAEAMKTAVHDAVLEVKHVNDVVREYYLD